MIVTVKEQKNRRRDIRKQQETSRRTVNNDGSNSSSTTKSVGFDKIVIMEFLPALGDNPSVSQGVPVALSDEAVRTKKYRLDLYEMERRPRRDPGALLLQRDEREEM